MPAGLMGYFVTAAINDQIGWLGSGSVLVCQCETGASVGWLNGWMVG